MSIIPKLLKSRQKFPKPEANWNFGDFSKIQPGAGANDVAGWTGESLKAGLATIDLTQTTAAAQPVFDTDHIVFDGDKYLEGMPTQAGDFTYIVSCSVDPTASGNKVLLGRPDSGQRVAYFDDASQALVMKLQDDIEHITANGSFPSDGVKRVIAITRSGTAIEIYIDGVLLLSFASSSVFDPIGISQYNLSGFLWQGTVSRCIIYPEALTAAEVAAKTASLS